MEIISGLCNPAVSRLRSTWEVHHPYTRTRTHTQSHTHTFSYILFVSLFLSVFFFLFVSIWSEILCVFLWWRQFLIIIDERLMTCTISFSKHEHSKICVIWLFKVVPRLSPTSVCISRISFESTWRIVFSCQTTRLFISLNTISLLKYTFISLCFIVCFFVCFCCCVVISFICFNSL